MKRPRMDWILMALLLGLICHQPADAQYSIPHSVLGRGSDAISNSSYSIVGTVSQTAIGVLSSPSNINSAGFWYLAPPSPVEVVIPDTVAAYADTVLVPVRVTGTTARDIVAAEISVAYDSRVVTPASPDRTEIIGTMVETEWSIEEIVLPGTGDIRSRFRYQRSG